MTVRILTGNLFITVI